MFYILIGPQGIKIRGPFAVKAYLQVGQDYLVYTLKKDLPFSLFFNLPDLQKSRRNHLSCGFLKIFHEILNQLKLQYTNYV